MLDDFKTEAVITVLRSQVAVVDQMVSYYTTYASLFHTPGDIITKLSINLYSDDTVFWINELSNNAIPNSLYIDKDMNGENQITNSLLTRRLELTSPHSRHPTISEWHKQQELVNEISLLKLLEAA